MKNFLLSLAVIALMASCKKDEVDPQSSDYKISIAAGITEETIVTTKAPISSAFSANFNTGIYASGATWNAGSTSNLINNDMAAVSGALPHPIIFSNVGPYYYPTDGSMVNFYAFTPWATEFQAAGAGVSPIVQMSITGQEDVMWASSTGQKIGSSAAVPPVFNFAHKLTQLQFTVVAGTGFSADSLTSLKVLAQPNTVRMTVGTGACAFSGSADIEALSANKPITITPTNLNSPIMTQIASSYQIRAVTKSGAVWTTTVSLSSQVGYAHMITLTFTGTIITGTATVANWATGAGGSGTMQ